MHVACTQRLSQYRRLLHVGCKLLLLVLLQGLRPHDSLLGMRVRVTMVWWGG